jgi:hypothetical protein
MSKIREGNLRVMIGRLQDAGAKYVALLLLAAISACGGEQAADAPPQKWQDMEVRVESRPSPPSAGMNEFLIIVTGERGQPDSDLVVSLRTSDQDPWKQAMQDGLVGVYRRAVEVGQGTRSVLQVQIKRNGAESELRFPLHVAH